MWERRPWGRKLRERRRVPWPPRQDQGLAEETWTGSEAAGAGDVASPFSSGLGKSQDHPTGFLSSVHWQEGNNIPLKITNREVNGASVLALEGRIVLGAEGDALREELQTLVHDGKKTRP